MMNVHALTITTTNSDAIVDISSGVVSIYFFFSDTLFLPPIFTPFFLGGSCQN